MTEEQGAVHSGRCAVRERENDEPAQRRAGNAVTETVEGPRTSGSGRQDHRAPTDQCVRRGQRQAGSNGLCADSRGRIRRHCEHRQPGRFVAAETVPAARAIPDAAVPLHRAVDGDTPIIDDGHGEIQPRRLVGVRIQGEEGQEEAVTNDHTECHEQRLGAWPGGRTDHRASSARQLCESQRGVGAATWQARSGAGIGRQPSAGPTDEGLPSRSARSSPRSARTLFELPPGRARGCVQRRRMR